MGVGLGSQDGQDDPDRPVSPPPNAPSDPPATFLNLPALVRRSM